MIAETAIIENAVEIGEGTKIWHFTHVCNSAKIGKNCTIGEGVYIGPGVVIGDNCKIQNHAQIFQGVTIGNNVFIGPCVCFTNDKYPAATGEWNLIKTYVQHDVSIGANSTVLCGITLGLGCLVGAGSVVTKSVETFKKVYGNPAN